MVVDCLALWLGITQWKVKRNLANQNRHADRFYPHSILAIHLQLAVAFEYEVAKFARMWCSDETNIVAEVKALKEIIETENGDDATWYIELLSNKYNESLG